MLLEIKRLFREAALYGLATVVGRLLNVLLLPLYTHTLAPADYGLVATVFSYIGFSNVLYGYGLDFAYMRHCEQDREESAPSDAFSTSFWSLLGSSLALSILIHALAEPLSDWAGLPPHLSDISRYSAWILALDALALVPFASLRMAHRGGAYVTIKVANIAMNLALNYFFLARLGLGVRGVFLASLLTSCATLAMLSPVLMSQLKPCFDRGLHKEMLRFALPLIPAGLASMAVQLIDRPILKFLSDDATVGLYQANYRLGIFMMMVVNMFDAAWRPFFIERAGSRDEGPVLARVLTYFFAVGSSLLLLVSLFIPYLAALPLPGGRSLIHPAYWSGLSIVPVVTLAHLLHGVYVNLLAPAALAKRSELVAYATALGALVNVAANILLIPAWGMMGAAAAALAAYAAMAAALYAMGRRIYPVPYEGRRLAQAALAAALVGAAAWLCGLSMTAERLWLRLGLWLAFPLALAATGFFEPAEVSALRSWLSGREERPEHRRRGR